MERVRWGQITLTLDLALNQATCEATGHIWSGACIVVFLRNAVEIHGDGSGNDNTLCESGETCLYTPNIGAYQGHGTLVPAATIGAGGAVENVELLEYEFNGY